MKDARKRSQVSLLPSKLFTVLLAAVILTGFALVACSADAGSQEPRVVDETPSLGQTVASPVAATSGQDKSEPQPVLKQESRVAGETADLGQTAAAPVAATSDQDKSEPQPARDSGTPLVSDDTSEEVVSQTTKPGRDVGDLAYSFTLPSVSGTTFSLDAQRGDKNVVVVFYRAFW